MENKCGIREEVQINLHVITYRYLKKIIPAKPLSFSRVHEKIPKKNFKSSFLNLTYSFFKLKDSFFKLKG